MKKRRIALLLAYDGRPYSGWQIQPVDRTVQGTLEDAIASLVGMPIRITGAGRTDAGVSAWGQVAHVDLPEEFSIPVERLPRILNTRLPHEVRVLDTKPMDHGFHARHSAIGKIYKYSFRILPDFLSHHPVADPYSAPIRASFDSSKVLEASKTFIGRHDFRHFSVASSLPEDPVRTVTDILWEPLPAGIALWISGPGFLHRMVRMIGGFLKEVGEGRRSHLEALDLLKPGSPPPVRAIEPLPPNGLALIRVCYGEQDPFDPRNQNWYPFPEQNDLSTSERIS